MGHGWEHLVHIFVDVVEHLWTVVGRDRSSSQSLDVKHLFFVGFLLSTYYIPYNSFSVFVWIAIGGMRFQFAESFNVS